MDDFNAVWPKLMVRTKLSHL